MAEHHRQTARAKPPISRHPLFPWIAALWGGALLSIASLAVGTWRLEALVLALHLDAIVPAAAPPLGQTARLLIAMLAGSMGGAVGWLAASLFADAGRPRRTGTPADKSEMTPPVDAPPATRAWFGFLGLTPRPRQAPQILNVNEVALDLPFAPLPDETVEDTSTPPVQAAFLHGAVAVEGETAADRIAAADLDTLSHVELMERLAIAMERRRARRVSADGAEAGEAASQTSEAVVRFPDQNDRQIARLALRSAARQPAPEQTEKALREALDALQRMSGSR